MNDRRRGYRARRRGALLVIAVLLAGYPSNALSIAACQRDAAGALMAHYRSWYGRNPVPPMVLWRDDTAEAASLLTGAGFEVRRCALPPEQALCAPACYPSAHVGPAYWRVPFVVTVAWGHSVGCLAGGGAETVYIAVFGRIWPVGYRSGWVS
jgi:hypothetical protein